MRFLNNIISYAIRDQIDGSEFILIQAYSKLILDEDLVHCLAVEMDSAHEGMFFIGEYARQSLN